MKPVGSPTFASLTLTLELPQAELGSCPWRPEHTGLGGRGGPPEPPQLRC